jgi:hypothetical protein
VEEGTHEQLLAQQGWYGALWRSQTDHAKMTPRPQLALASAAGTNGNGYACRNGESHG